MGSAELTSKAVFLLREVADALAGAPYAVTVEGHTDNIPIRSKMFPSNWELSAVRASSVARFLIFHGIDSNHVKVMGLADTMPLLPNTNAQGRPIPQNQVQNRRVVIVLTPLSSRSAQ